MKLPEKIKWAPSTDAGEKSCFQLYGEYVTKRRTITQLALEHRLTSDHVRQRIKWAAYRMLAEKEDNDVVRQISDSYLMDHLERIETELEGCEKESVRATLLKERRLTLKDLADIRGVRDFGRDRDDGKINIILPNLKRGEGTTVIAQKDKNDPQTIVVEEEEDG